MATTISIRSLIKKRADEPAPEAFSLGEAHRGSLPQWEALAGKAAEELSTMLGAKISCAVELSIIEHRTLREDAPEAGLLLFLGEEDSGALFRVPGDGPQMLSSLLLRDEYAEDVPEDPEDVDAELFTGIADLFLQLLKSGFDMSLARGDAPYVLDWPLTPPPAGPRLMAAFDLSLGGERRAAVEIIFPSTEEKALSAFAGKAERTVDPALILLEAEAVLARWPVRAEEVGELQVGSRIALPGAATQKVRLETMAGGEPATLLTGMLTQDSGRRAISYRG